jgi:hypothetical protein
MELPMHLSAECMPDDPKTQAFLYGPLVLAGDLGSEGLSERVIVGPNAPPMRRSNTNVPARPDAPPRVPPIDIPTFHSAPNADPASWIKPGDKALSFRTTGQQKDVDLVPINSIFDKRYSVYWQVS